MRTEQGIWGSVEIEMTSPDGSLEVTEKGVIVPNMCSDDATIGFLHWAAPRASAGCIKKMIFRLDFWEIFPRVFLSLFPFFSSIAPFMPPSSIVIHADFEICDPDPSLLDHITSFFSYLSFHKDKIKGLELKLKSDTAPFINSVLRKVQQANISLLSLRVCMENIVGSVDFHTLFSSLKSMPSLLWLQIYVYGDRIVSSRPSYFSLSRLSLLFPNIQKVLFDNDCIFFMVRDSSELCSLPHLRTITIGFDSAASLVNFFKELSRSVKVQRPIPMNVCECTVQLQLRPSADGQFLECPELATLPALEVPSTVDGLYMSFYLTLSTPEHKKLPLKLVFPKRLFSFSSGRGRLQKLALSLNADSDIQGLEDAHRLWRQNKQHSVRLSSCLGPISELESVCIYISFVTRHRLRNPRAPEHSAPRPSLEIDPAACLAELRLIDMSAPSGPGAAGHGRDRGTGPGESEAQRRTTLTQARNIDRAQQRHPTIRWDCSGWGSVCWIQAS